MFASDTQSAVRAPAPTLAAGARRLHRQLAWVTALVAMLWAATGFLHPIMSWTAPRPAVQAPPQAVVPAASLVAPGPALAAAGVETTSRVRLVALDDQLLWSSRGPTASGRVYVDARTGAPAAADTLDRHAVALARHYAALPETRVTSIQRIDAFSLAYPRVNKLLPVWEVKFDTPDALTVYVDPEMDRLAAVSNTPRRVMLTLFQSIHTMTPLRVVEPLRIGIILALQTALIATVVFGFVMAWRARGRGLFRAHLIVALVAAPFVLAFSGSGVVHMLLSARPEPAVIEPMSFDVATLTAPMTAADTAELAALPDKTGAPMWRAASPSGAVRYTDAMGAPIAMSDAQRALELAGAEGHGETRLVTAFGKGYGFINKRLPVIAVDGHGHHGDVYVDVREGVIAAAPKDEQAHLDHVFFDTVHKWQWLNPIGRKNRDMIMMGVMALIIMTAGMGLALAIRRRR